MPQKISNIHDKFVKEMLSDRGLAIAFLSNYLPEEVGNLLLFDSMHYESTSYLSKELKESFSDIVWSISTKSNSRVKICLLLEHKSYIEPNAAFQILEYMALGYQKQLKNKQKVELILPILYYHGQAKWVYRPIKSYFTEYDAVFQKYLPNHHTEFVDLAAMSEENIESLANGLLRSTIMLQKYYPDGEALMSRVGLIMENLLPYLESTMIHSIFVYILQNDYVDKKKLKQTLAILPKNINNNIMSIYDELIQEGIEKGKLEGIEEGIEKTILNAFANNIDLNTIRLITGEPLEKINAVLLKNGISKA